MVLIIDESSLRTFSLLLKNFSQMNRTRHTCLLYFVVILLFLLFIRLLVRSFIICFAFALTCVIVNCIISEGYVLIIYSRWAIDQFCKFVIIMNFVFFFVIKLCVLLCYTKWNACKTFICVYFKFFFNYLFVYLIYLKNHLKYSLSSYLIISIFFFKVREVNVGNLKLN